MIDGDNIPTDGTGRRLPLELALRPNYEPAGQPTEISIGAS